MNQNQEQAFVGSPWGPNPASWPGVGGVAGETNYLPYVKNPYLPDPMNAGMQPSAPGLIGGARKKSKNGKGGKVKKGAKAGKKKSVKAKSKAHKKKEVSKYICSCVYKTEPKCTCQETSKASLKCIANNSKKAKKSKKAKNSKKSAKAKKSKKGTQQKGGMGLGNISFAIEEAYNTAVGQETPINADPDPRVQPIGQKGDDLIVGGNIDVPNAYLNAQKTAGSM